MEAIRRKRSRTGCMTCRARKVRCDEQHPACGACQRLCLPCTFPSPADLARGNRKSAQPRQSRFCVRFVDGANITNSGRSPRYDRSTGLGPSPRSPPTSTSSCSPKGPGPGPGPGPGSGPGPGQGLLYSTPSPPSSTLWPTDSDHASLAAASAVPSSMFFHPGTSTIIDMDLLHAASLESDVDLLWDTLPAFDDFVPGPEGPFPMANVPPVTQPVARPPPLDPAPSHSLSATPPAPKQMVLMRSEDREPLQHFLSTMVQFVKLRTSNSDNIYCYIFTSMALTHAPLYEAILAWAALHMAHVQSASTEDAEQRFQRASQLLYEDTEAASHVDLTVVTVWFLLQYELFLASGVDRFVALLDYVAGTVEPLFARHSAIAINERLGPVAVRVLVWLAAFDSRAAVLGNPCRLLRCLQQHLTDGQDRDFVSARDSSLVLDQYSVSSSSMAAATEMQACLSLSLRLNVARGSCTILGRWHGDVAKRDAGWQSLCGSLAAIRRQMKQQDSVPAAQLALRVASGAMDAPSTLSALEYNWLQLTATYYGMVAAYHRNRPASLPEDPVEAGLPSSADCAARIIRISRQATLSRPNTPQAIWPPVLFTAAVETTDPIYQAWAIGAFISAEAWAPHLRRTRQLLERMIELRREVKGPYSIATAMEATGGVFVL